jgi:hypothetical protein
VKAATRIRLRGAVTFLWDIQNRERKRLLAEAVQIKGLMPLLMKHRNGQRWSKEERAELRMYLRRLSEISPYLVVVMLPGAPLTLPMLAWWLDRRRQGRKPDPREAEPVKPS